MYSIFEYMKLWYGSVRDQESIEAADKYGLTMVFTGVRHFRH